jgi:hypothetical protein
MRRRGIPTLLPMLALLLGASPSFALCTGFAGSVPSFQPLSPTAFASYDPTRPTDTVVTIPITINPASGMSPPCTLIVNILPSFNPGMSNGSSFLAYTVGGDFAGALSGSPFTGIQYQAQNGFPQAFSLSMTIPNRQAVPQGNYSEQLNLRIFASGSTQPLVQTIITFAAQVTASCTLPAPNVSQLNFSQGVANGRVTHGYKLSALIQGASCSGPSRLILRGTPMQVGMAVPPAFDNRIHYQATAKLGSATTILSTDSASEALATLPATSGTMSIDVSLVDKGKTQAAGTYSSVLSIVLEPLN